MNSFTGTTIDDILSSCGLEQHLPEIDCNDYVKESKKILRRIVEAYNDSHKKKWLPVEIRKSINDNRCDSCSQECELKIDGKIRKVFADNERGDCFFTYFDEKEFAEKMEEIIIGDNAILYELIEFDVITGLKDTNGKEIYEGNIHDNPEMLK